LAVSISAMLLVPVWPLDFSRGDAQGRRMAEEETDEVPKLPPDARLESLDERLDRVQRREAEEARKKQVDPNMRAAQLVIGYLIGGPLGGGLLGWGLDSLFHTKPWLTLVMLFLGFAVGVRNILRISKTPPGPRPGAGA
jgi:ATP synthase protein I